MFTFFRKVIHQLNLWKCLTKNWRKWAHLPKNLRTLFYLCELLSFLKVWKLFSESGNNWIPMFLIISGTSRTEILCLKAWNFHQKGNLKIISMTWCWIFLAYNEWPRVSNGRKLIWLLALQGFILTKIYQNSEILWHGNKHKFSTTEIQLLAFGYLLFSNYYLFLLLLPFKVAFYYL